MKRLLNIAFQGGTHGNFLRYFIDRFSALTPEIKELPFTENGTSHNAIKYSGLIHRYHPVFGIGDIFSTTEGFDNVNEPHILISVSTNDILFLQRIVNQRAGDHKIDIDQEYVSLSSDYIKMYKIKDKFNNLYNINVNENTRIPKFIFRDFFKLSFLDLTKDGFIEENARWILNLPINCKLFPVSAFWNKELFFSNIERINKEFDLKLTVDQNAEYVYDLFVKNIKQYDTRNRCEIIIEALKNKQNLDISNIDTVEQAYLSAHIEKKYKFITVPLTNYFFKSTSEILKWIEWYPEYYKAMNPNLPTFNGIPNPYYLHNLRK
jgi:hypothetical protein